MNKVAYLNAASLFPNLLMGAELHVRNYSNARPYHCHIFFRSQISADTIDALNRVLDTLYPKKSVCESDPIPTIEEIAKHFDAYEFVLLPHGGQSHSTFDKSIPKDVQFDTTIERSIYYNHFDGFTARSNSGLESTQDYFRRLGIADFVNLITSTDNYNPDKYPESKNSEAEPFVPTWMLASPTFNGLRLSLSESARLVYGTRPDTWAEFIQHVSLPEVHGLRKRMRHCCCIVRPRSHLFHLCHICSGFLFGGATSHLHPGLAVPLFRSVLCSVLCHRISVQARKASDL